MPKLKLVIADDQVERVTLSLHTSVWEQLREYRAFYEDSLGGKLQQSYLIEEMLKSCMTEDKDFLKYLKSRPKDAPAATPSAGDEDDEAGLSPDAEPAAAASTQAASTSAAPASSSFAFRNGN